MTMPLWFREGFHRHTDSAVISLRCTHFPSNPQEFERRAKTKTKVGDLQAYSEHAEFFENRNRAKLFGIQHHPDANLDPEIGVVFCHPISWEKQFSYRCYAEYSRYLAAKGFTSMRFDAFGFGDSEGDLVDATMESLIEDVQDAIERLRTTADCSRFVLIGARLGATVAALAAARQPAVTGLVLVSPVLDGKAYWKEMIRFSRFARMSQGQALVSSKSIDARLQSEGCAELDAEQFSKRFVEELNAVDLLGGDLDFRGSCMLRELTTGGSPHKEIERFADRLKAGGAEVSASFDEPKPFWLMSSRYEGYVPRELFRRTAGWLSEEAVQ